VCSQENGVGDGLNEATYMYFSGTSPVASCKVNILWLWSHDCTVRFLLTTMVWLLLKVGGWENKVMYTQKVDGYHTCTYIVVGKWLS